MKVSLSFAAGVLYIAFGLLIIICPQWGAKILEAIPWRSGGLLDSKPIPQDQKKASPLFVRLLGLGCILAGLVICGALK